MARAPRWLVVTHRYLGVVLGGLMLLWCLSGAVMLFSPYPNLKPDERAARLPRIDWSHCCVLLGCCGLLGTLQMCSIASCMICQRPW